MPNSPRLADVKSKIQEAKTIKPVRHVPLPGNQPKPKEGAKARKCCNSPCGPTPHAVGCRNHPDTARKPKVFKKPTLKMRDEAEGGRWPDGTTITAHWGAGKWVVTAESEDGVLARNEGTAVHTLISKCFRTWATAEAMAEKTDTTSSPPSSVPGVTSPTD